MEDIFENGGNEQISRGASMRGNAVYFIFSSISDRRSDISDSLMLH